MDSSLLPIAIVGFSFEFAQDAVSEQNFWETIQDGKSLSSVFPKDRINIDAFHHVDTSRINTLPMKHGHFLKEDIGVFDAPFFNISPGEAACLDPQQRRMLETAYHALENAGIPMTQCCGSDTAVYTASFTNDYLSIAGQDHEVQQTYAALGATTGMIANRLSWFFDFKGTSMNIDTACSSSMVALHLACQELRTGATSMALVGGAGLHYHPDLWQMLSNGKFLSPDGRSWTFDSRANGYARGEGIAVLVVKRLNDALRDNDTIRALIRHTGVNQDGRTPGITQPSEAAQVNLIKKTYQQAGLSMEPTRFFETHGTGTAIGDPIEARAISTSFRESHSLNNRLYVGGVKANIGHLEGASGLAGIIKTILVLENGIIPPIAGLETLNPQLDAESLCLHFPRKTHPWPTTGIRRACVNSFGYGGTNGVAILDDAYHYLQACSIHGHHQTIASPLSEQNRRNSRALHKRYHDSPHLEPTKYPQNSLISGPTLLAWSTFDEESGKRLNDMYSGYIATSPGEALNLAYFLAERRTNFKWRSFAVVETKDGIAIPPISPSIPIRSLDHSSVAFVFTGQGAQYQGMGRNLCMFPVYEETLKNLDQDLASLGCQWSLRNIMKSNSGVQLTLGAQYSQVLTTALQLALTDLLRSLHILPSVVVGHSSGEIAAAYATGAVCRSSALKIAYWRGVLAAKLETSVNDQCMMAVGLSESEVEPYLRHLKEMHDELNVSIGCVNSPKSVTLTGKKSQMLDVQGLLQQNSVFSRMLQVTVAYHSKFMEDVAKEYLAAIGHLEAGNVACNVVMVSSVNGHVVDPRNLRDPCYWVKNMTSRVEFRSALSRVLSLHEASENDSTQSKLSSPVTHIIEVGPQGTLGRPVRDIVQSIPAITKPKYVHLLSRNSDAHRALLTAIGTLFCEGVHVDILAANDAARQSRPMPRQSPRYPFEHSKKYWRESRLSKNFRLRTVARHDVLGTRSLDWNPEVAQWRNTIRLSEIPWLADHTVNGRVVLPAAAMIAMVIEAVKQITVNQQDFTGIEIQDATFQRVMEFSGDDQTLETQLNLLPIPLEGIRGKWHSYRLFMSIQDQYIECSTGLVQLVAAMTKTDDLTDSAVFLGTSTPYEWATMISNHCQSMSTDPYELLTDYAVQYGPSFRSVSTMKLSHGENFYAASARIDPEFGKGNQKYLTSQEFEVHPAIIDGLAQLVAPTFVNAMISKLPALLPSYISRITIDRRHGTASKDTMITAHAQCHPKGRRGVVANILAIQEPSRQSFICLEGIEFVKTEDISTAKNETNSFHHDLCMQPIWKPDVDMIDDNDLLQYCTANRPVTSNAASEINELLELAMKRFIRRTLSFLNQNPSVAPQNHLRYYIQWLRYQDAIINEIDTSKGVETTRDQLHLAPEDKELNQLVASTSARGRHVVRIGESLEEILRGNLDPLKVVFQDNLIDEFYEEMMTEKRHFHPLSRYLDLMSFKTPALRILEIGAGTGGQTSRLLDILSRTGMMRCSQYDYTDISSSFFERARPKFEAFSRIMHYKVCDISKDPVDQGFVAASYDIVFAGHVIHATNSITASLQNIRLLLKPNGKLIMMESTLSEGLITGFTAGLLKGWWDPLQHESRSTLNPCLTSMTWHKQLQSSGFSGVDLNFTEPDGPGYPYGSILISTALPQQSNDDGHQSSIVIVLDFSCQAQKELADMLTGKSQSCQQHSIDAIQSVQLVNTTTIVFLLEIEQNFLNDISEHQYRKLQSTLVRFRNTVWVSRSGLRNPNFDPRLQLATGLGRSLSSEDASRKFVTLNLSRAKATLADNALTILKISRQIEELSVEELETEYTSTEDGVEICRIQKHNEMNQKILETSTGIVRKQVQLESTVGVELHPASLDKSEALEFYGCSIPSPPHAPDEVVIQVQAQGLNYRDVLLHSGQLDSHEPLTEIVGLVKIAGSSSGYSPGDRVCSIINTYGASHLRLKTTQVFRIPDEIDYTDAASLPLAAWISFYAIVEIGRLREGDSILIHKANTTVGQILVQMALKLRVDVIITASSASRRTSLCNQYGIRGDFAFDVNDPLLSRKILEVTSSKGVNLVVGSMEPEVEVNLAECAACLGRIFNTRLISSSRAVAVKPRDIKRGISISGIDVAELFARQPDVAYSILVRALHMLFDLQLRGPQPLHVFEAGDVATALAHLGDNTHVGKRILRYGSTSITVRLREPDFSTFAADATYIVAGGFGGIGRRIIRWMVNKGVRFLIILSRSGPSSDAAHTLLTELEHQGVVCATPKVDISDKMKLQNVLREMSQTMPSIKGCIQASMVLKDNLFQNMPYDDWSASVKSKVAGSWNLHERLPRNLDFFILLSSLAGIFGTPSQTNYAAGCAFEDALARHRLLQGLHAVSIDLGMLTQDGAVAESDFLSTINRRYGMWVDMSTEELLALLDHYCRPSLSVPDVSQAQIITGLEMPSAIVAKGYDVPHLLRRPIFSHLFCIDTQTQSTSPKESEDEQVDWKTLLQNASSVSERNQVALSWITWKLSLLLDLPQTEISPSEPLYMNGTDSLIAIDLKNWLQKELQAEIDILELHESPSLESLAELVVKRRHPSE